MPNWEAETVKKVLRNPPPVPVEDVPPVQWAPERAPARATPLAPEGVESPLANWARRLIIGPRSIVEQTLREEAQTRQDAARSREAMALEGRRETRARENLLLNIREQARVNVEAEARKQAEAQAARTRLMRGVIAAQPAPEGEPETRPRREEIIQEPGGAEMYKALREKPEAIKTAPPEHDVLGPRGEIIRKGTPKAPKAWYEGLTLPEMAMMEANLKRRIKAGIAGLEEQDRLSELTEGMKTYKDVTGALAERRGEGTERGRYREEQGQAIGEKASQYIDPETYTTPTPDTSRADVLKQYRHLPTGNNPGRQIRTVWGMLAKVADIANRREDLFFDYTGDRLVDAKSRIAAETAWRTKGPTGDPDISELRSLGATISTMVKAFGDTGNIAFQEQIIAKEAAGLEGADSRQAVLRRVSTLLSLVNEGMAFHGLKPLRIPGLDRAVNALEKKPVAGVPAPTSERRIKDPFRDIWGKGVQPQVRHD